MKRRWMAGGLLAALAAGLLLACRSDRLLFEKPAAFAARQFEKVGHAAEVSSDPAVVRRAYGIPADVAVLGPWQGKLDNAGEQLDLLAPVPLTGEAFAPGRVEAVSYGQGPPWPPGADGGGPSLERIDPPGYADEPHNWTAVSLQGTAGRPNTRVQHVWLPLVVTAP